MLDDLAVLVLVLKLMLDDLAVLVLVLKLPVLPDFSDLVLAAASMRN